MKETKEEKLERLAITALCLSALALIAGAMAVLQGCTARHRGVPVLREAPQEELVRSRYEPTALDLWDQVAEAEICGRAWGDE